MKIIMKLMSGKTKTYNLPWQTFICDQNEFEELGILSVRISFPDEADNSSLLAFEKKENDNAVQS